MIPGISQIPLDTSFSILSPRFFPGWQAQNVSHPFVIFDKTVGCYRMYYSGSSSTQVNESLWDQWVTGVVMSANTLDWNYPDNYEQVLFARKYMEGDVVDPNESAGIFDAVFAVDACVIKDGPDYKCWYTGWNGQIEHIGSGLSKKINFRIGYATSPDGTNWTKFPGTAGAESVLGVGNLDELDAYGAEDPYVIKENGLYRMWYVGYDGNTRRLHYATSSDGIHWVKKGVVFHYAAKNALDKLDEQNPVVINRLGRYELWYQGKSISSPSYHVIRAISHDGMSWEKTGEVMLHPTVIDRSLPYSPWSSISYNKNGKIILGSIIVHPDNSCQVFYARPFNAQKKVTYGVINTSLLFIFTERINP
ncbi:MAG: hypothetical protein AB2L24_31265 [Mangrovibacterium sp.]